MNQNVCTVVRGSRLPQDLRGGSFRWQSPLPPDAAASRLRRLVSPPRHVQPFAGSASLTPAGRSGTNQSRAASSLRNFSMICAVPRSNNRYSPGALALNSCRRSFAAFKSSPASSQMNLPSLFLLKRSSEGRMNSPFSSSATIKTSDAVRLSERHTD